MYNPTEYEIDLMRELMGEDRGLFWGAAMSDAVESLRSSGYLQGYTTITITDRGKQFIEQYCPEADNV